MAKTTGRISDEILRRLFAEVYTGPRTEVESQTATGRGLSALLRGLGRNPETGREAVLLEDVRTLGGLPLRQRMRNSTAKTPIFSGVEKDFAKVTGRAKMSRPALQNLLRKMEVFFIERNTDSTPTMVRRGEHEVRALSQFLGRSPQRVGSLDVRGRQTGALSRLLRFAPLLALLLPLLDKEGD